MTRSCSQRHTNIIAACGLPKKRVESRGVTLSSSQDSWCNRRTRFCGARSAPELFRAAGYRGTTDVSSEADSQWTGLG